MKFKDAIRIAIIVYRVGKAAKEIYEKHND